MFAASDAIEQLGAEDGEAVVEVLCEAFHDYPVMRYVLGEEPAAEERLRRLIGLFTAARLMRGHPVTGCREPDGRLIGVVTMTPPDDAPAPAAFEALVESTWSYLGRQARERYEEIRAAWSRTSAPAGCWHVNMLGVRPDCRGRRVGSRLLHAARVLAAAEGNARGVDLTTEDPENLKFYRARGFEPIAYLRVAPTLETWTLVAPPLEQ